MSTTLTVTLGSILILVGLVGLIFFSRSRRQSKPKYAVPPVKSRTPEQELNDLGILEIRPRESSAAVHTSPEEEGGAEEDTLEHVENVEVFEVQVEPENASQGIANDEEEELEEETVELADESVVEEVIEEATVLKEISPLHEQTEQRTAVSRRETLFRMMSAVQASLDCYTACLVRQDGSGAYSIEAIVSQNPQILHAGSMSVDASLIEQKGISTSAVSVLEVGGNITADRLGYYKESVDIRQVAIAQVKIPDNPDGYYLLVDALAWQDLDDPWQRLMIGQFANLLGTFMATPQLDQKAEGDAKPRVRPRREIIEEEMLRARDNNEPLALALVYLNQAEDISRIGPGAVGGAENALENFLKETLSEARIERFGELTFGVFHAEPVSEVEAWALLVQEEIEEDGNAYFERGISVGIALLKDHHQNADDLRADATEALRESFETGACTIIE